MLDMLKSFKGFSLKVCIEICLCNRIVESKLSHNRVILNWYLSLFSFMAFAETNVKIANSLLYLTCASKWLIIKFTALSAMVVGHIRQGWQVVKFIMTCHLCRSSASNTLMEEVDQQEIVHPSCLWPSRLPGTFYLPLKDNFLKQFPCNVAKTNESLSNDVFKRWSPSPI